MSDSINERQENQPWTVPYSYGVDEAKGAGFVPHILASHCALHVAKTAGKLAAVFEEMDHPHRMGGTAYGPSAPYDDGLQTIKNMAADLFTEALRFANLYGFNLADEHARRVAEKNAAPPPVSTAEPGAPPIMCGAYAAYHTWRSLRATTPSTTRSTTAAPTIRTKRSR